mmetsp:Transcript_12823/g.31227  ORF Transcript_12823/g.31227 Transcript_12823/m.31227 type:complete len:244 (-) Transcript_12823:800-1531(-)
MVESHSICVQVALFRNWVRIKTTLPVPNTAAGRDPFVACAMDSAIHCEVLEIPMIVRNASANAKRSSTSAGWRSTGSFLPVIASHESPKYTERTPLGGSSSSVLANCCFLTPALRAGRLARPAFCTARCPQASSLSAPCNFYARGTRRRSAPACSPPPVRRQHLDLAVVLFDRVPGGGAPSFQLRRHQAAQHRRPPLPVHVLRAAPDRRTPAPRTRGAPLLEIGLIPIEKATSAKTKTSGRRT